MIRIHYEILADLLEYPMADNVLPFAEYRELLKTYSATFVSELRLFFDKSDDFSLSDRQELYTRTFDLNPACALEIGYHLFGENYKRGAFLANLRETQASFDLDQTHELPDYLPVLLRLLNKLGEGDLRQSLIADCMVPALEKMLKSLRETENPYCHLLTAIVALLRVESGFLCATSVSSVPLWSSNHEYHHRDTEDTEVAQRRSSNQDATEQGGFKCSITFSS